MTTTYDHTSHTSGTEPTTSGSPKLTWHGIKTVTKLELMQRVRSSRWKTTLLFWFVGVGAICILFASAAQANMGDGTPVGPIIFAANVYFILFMGMLITPTLSSTAINGDRERGTLAILQASLLTPLEITIGKLLASWIASMAFLAVSVPFIFWAFAAGGVTVSAVFSSIAMMAVLLLVVCAVSLYLSARIAKPAGSTVLSYGFIALTCVISVLLWGLSILTVSTPVTRTGYEGSDYDPATGNPTQCVPYKYESEDHHTDKYWGLLAVNPFVLVADAATPAVDSIDSRDSEDEFLRTISAGVRSTRTDAFDGGWYDDSWCTDDGKLRTEKEREDYQAVSQIGGPVWPAGLVFHLAVGALAVWRTSKRLQTPYAQLPKGIRIA